MNMMDDSSIFVLLFQIMQLTKYQAIRRMDELKLKPSQAAILFVLHCKGNMSQRELAEVIGITPPSMTVALRKMEDQGYVFREPDRNDQRIMRIHLAPKGIECVDGVKCVIKEMEELTLKGLSQEETLFMRRLLSEMKKNLLESRDFKGMNLQEIMDVTKPSLKNQL